MELNITLVVQAINFLFAYLIMRHCLFKQAIACVEAERDYSASLVAAVSDRKIVVEQKVFEKQERWKACQYKLAQNEPSLRAADERIIVGKHPGLTIPAISESDVAVAIGRSVVVMKKIGDLS